MVTNEMGFRQSFEFGEVYFYPFDFVNDETIMSLLGQGDHRSYCMCFVGTSKYDSNAHSDGHETGISYVSGLSLEDENL